MCPPDTEQEPGRLLWNLLATCFLFIRPLRSLNHHATCHALPCPRASVATCGSTSSAKADAFASLDLCRQKKGSLGSLYLKKSTCRVHAHHSGIAVSGQLARSLGGKVDLGFYFLWAPNPQITTSRKHKESTVQAANSVEGLDIACSWLPCSA